MHSNHHLRPSSSQSHLSQSNPIPPQSNIHNPSHIDDTQKDSQRLTVVIVLTTLSGIVHSVYSSVSFDWLPANSSVAFDLLPTNSSVWFDWLPAKSSVWFDWLPTKSSVWFDWLLTNSPVWFDWLPTNSSLRRRYSSNRFFIEPYLARTAVLYCVQSRSYFGTLRDKNRQAS